MTLRKFSSVLAAAILMVAADAGSAIAQAITLTGQVKSPGGQTIDQVPTQIVNPNNGTPCFVGNSGCPPIGGSGGGVATIVTTDKSGTVTTGGAAQNAIAANPLRKGWCIQNTDAAEVMYVRANGTASATTGTKLTAGAQACSSPSLIDLGVISVFAATTSHPWSGFEAQ